MSPFIVADKTINNVLSYIPHTSISNMIRRFLNIAYIDTVENHLQLLGEAMLSLNEDVVSIRYNEVIARRNFKYQYQLVSPVVAYKALRCWLYQCSEGNIPNHPLFILMDEVSKQVAMEIVDNLPEYDSAPWDD